MNPERSLDGRRFLLTCPRRRAVPLAGALLELGAEVAQAPLLEQSLLRDVAFHEVSYSQWLVFPSLAGVDLFFELLRTRRVDVRRLMGLDLAALGPGTAEALIARGLFPRLTASGEGAGDALAARLHPGDQVFLVRGKGERSALAGKLGQVEGVEVVSRAVYETVLLPPPDNFPALLDGRTYPVFTSPLEAAAFVDAAKSVDLSAVTALCADGETAAKANQSGLTVKAAKEATPQGLVELALSLQ